MDVVKGDLKMTAMTTEIDCDQTAMAVTFPYLLLIRRMGPNARGVNCFWDWVDNMYYKTI
jgi:hypothetical protein